MTPTSSESQQPVWDLFVRLFHWALLLGVSGAVITGAVLGPTWITLHIVAGVSALVLVLSRVFWGMLGGTYARFSGFLTSPQATITHLKELRAGKAGRHIGHNPLGGYMIVALIALIIALGLTGTLALGGVFKTGPMAALVGYDFGSILRRGHKLFYILLLVLVALHVAGALFEGMRTKENLPKAMVTGKKDTRKGDHHPAPARAHPLLMLASFGLFGALSVVGVVWLMAMPVPRMPVVPLDPTYADECAACHNAYHPSLMRAQGWALLMEGLDDHFGEDASLDPDTTAQIADWLVSHSAETVDTKPAHVLANSAAYAPFTLTETPFWKARHAAIPAEQFRAPPIYDNGNCAACHQDAETGLFYPANISIPKETPQ